MPDQGKLNKYPISFKDGLGDLIIKKKEGPEIRFIQSKNIFDYKELLEQLIPDLDYVFSHAVLAWCNIVSQPIKNHYQQIWLVTNYDGGIIGVCGLNTLPGVTKNDEMWISWLGLLPAYRNKRLAPYIIDFLCETSRSCGALVLCNSVNKNDIKTLKLHDRNGFSRICQTKIFLAERGLDYINFPNENKDNHTLVSKILI